MSPAKKQPAAAPAPAPAPEPTPEPEPAPVAAAPAKPDFNGTFRFVRNEEDFEKYLEAVGLNWLSRKMAISSPSELKIVQEADQFTITQKKTTWKFTVGGEEFEDTVHNGCVMKVSSQWDGEKLVLNLEPKEEGKGKSEKQTREIQDQELIVTHEVGELKAKRIFKRVT